MIGREPAAGEAVADLSRIPELVMKTTVSSKGQIVLPAELREQDRIEPGEEFTVERLDGGEYRLVRLVHDLVVATRNRSDFEKAGIEIVDPYTVW